jgi:hypothetical protein
MPKFKFRWGKSTDSQHSVVEQQEIIVENKPTVDEILHKEVYSTQELLLREAERIINEPSKYDEEKHQRLLKLHQMGFKGVEEVKELKEIDDEIHFQKQLKETIEYYSKHYPLYRFITVDAVAKVCETYGLLLVDIQHYIGEIPEKNQKELVNFKVRRGDTRAPKETYGWDDPRRYGSNEYDNAHIAAGKQHNKDYEEEMIGGRDLLIIAPAKKIDLKNMEVHGHIVTEKATDPIILQCVESIGFSYGSRKIASGYLIATSWGLEASDENVTNAIHN